jgi:hypothetical protein
MLGLLKRREVEILLEAGHRRTEVARLTGISPSSVGRIAGKASIEHFNDTAERRKRRIGRPSIVEGFRKMISDILEKEAELPSLEILRQVRKAGYSGGKTCVSRKSHPRRMPLKSATYGRELEPGLRRRPGSNNVTFDRKPLDGVFGMHRTAP